MIGSSRRKSSVAWVVAALSAAVAAPAFAQPTPAPAPPAATTPPNPEDLLGTIVVEAGATRPLPKIAVLPSLASDMALARCSFAL